MTSSRGLYALQLSSCRAFRGNMLRGHWSCAYGRAREVPTPGKPRTGCGREMRRLFGSRLLPGMTVRDFFVWAPDDFMAQMSKRYDGVLPELVIALARPLGTNDIPVRKVLDNFLRIHRYLVKEIKISDLLLDTSVQVSVPTGSEGPTPPRSVTHPRGYQRLLSLMRWGDDLREGVDSSVAGMLAIAEISRLRPEEQTAAKDAGDRGVAYVVRNLLHPQEVGLLRSVYKQRFFLVGIHQDYSERQTQLTKRLTNDGDPPSEAPNNALHLLQIDAGLRPSTDHSSENALNIDDTFHKADVFVGYGEDESKPIIKRWLDQVFGNPFGSPTREELAMAVAYLAAKQSVSLGRSVGAALIDPAGSLLSFGWNDPAKPHGGVCREGDKPDGRDHVEGEDPSDGHRITTIAHFLQSLLFDEWKQSDVDRLPEVERAWLIGLRSSAENLRRVDRSVVRALAAVQAMSSQRLFNIIEFGRSVHAEMAAITDAARRGVSTQGAHLFVTTFPCHECARNVVAAGIDRVTFVEPYGKSLASQLYDDSIEFSTSPVDERIADREKVLFAPFAGISPKRFDELFSGMARKHSLRALAKDANLPEGGTVDWADHQSQLRPSINGYLSEKGAVDPYFEMAKQMAEQSVMSRLAEGLTKHRANTAEES